MLQLLFLLVVLLLGESSLGVLAVICPEYLGVTVTKTQLAESLQRTYGVPGKEQFTAAIDLAQTTVRRTSHSLMKFEIFLFVPVAYRGGGFKPPPKF
jgi:hypothetical protein